MKCNMNRVKLHLKLADAFCRAEELPQQEGQDETGRQVDISGANL